MASPLSRHEPAEPPWEMVKDQKPSVGCTTGLRVRHDRATSNPIQLKLYGEEKGQEEK